MRILVVDDDRAVRESLRRSLSFNGYTVDLAEDGVEALDAISSERPDALVLDVMMPAVPPNSSTTTAILRFCRMKRPSNSLACMASGMMETGRMIWRISFGVLNNS